MQMPPYIMLTMLGRGTIPHDRLGEMEWMATTVTQYLQPPVGQSPGLMFHACGKPSDNVYRADL